MPIQNVIVLFQRWVEVPDVGPALNQRCPVVYCQVVIVFSDTTLRDSELCSTRVLKRVIQPVWKFEYPKAT